MIKAINRLFGRWVKWIFDNERRKTKMMKDDEIESIKEQQEEDARMERIRRGWIEQLANNNHYLSFDYNFELINEERLILQKMQGCLDDNVWSKEQNARGDIFYHCDNDTIAYKEGQKIIVSNENFDDLTKEAIIDFLTEYGDQIKIRGEKK